MKVSISKKTRVAIKKVLEMGIREFLKLVMRLSIWVVASVVIKEPPKDQGSEYM